MAELSYMYDFRQRKDPAQLVQPIDQLAHLRAGAYEPPSIGVHPQSLVLPTGGGAPGSVGGDWRSSLSPAESWIIQHESGFNPTARNKSSGAFGIWQGLGDTLTNYAKRFGYDRGTTDPNQQLNMFRAYVADRYGSAEKAQQFWQSHGWY